MKRAIAFMTVFVAVAFLPASATIINVPGDQPNIQAGIDASSDRDTVRIASGTYVENIDFSGKNIVVGSWFLDDGDTSYVSSTIIDGGASGSVVIFENGEDNSAVITGFTIQNGNAEYGGGFFCYDNSSPTIISNTISGNTVGWGGGIYCYNYSSPTIINNTISGNSASQYYGCSGGGICCDYNSSPTISNNTISGNSADYDGGGICCYNNSSPTISNNTISRNTAAWGGGIACYGNSSPTINYNTISGNSATVYHGGGIFCLDSNPAITNTIFWGDSALIGPPEIYLWGTSLPVITYCDIQDTLWPGEGNIDCDPMFCAPGNGNYYLNVSSCCVGAGEGGVDIGAFGVGCGTPHIINIPADYETIQEGINASSDGDTVRVASGTYVENIDFSGKNIVVGSWFLDDGDTSFISSTIIDGNQSGSVVSFLLGEDNTAVITGFTIQNGFAEFGGGIDCYGHSSPTITNNTISGNSVGDGGGGICCHDNSSSTITNNTITGNTSTYGGGIDCYWHSNPTISNNTISENSATWGGGIDCYYSSPVITNTIFWADSAPNGPEIYLGGTSSPVITYCDVQGGWAGEGNIDVDPLFRDPENGDFHLMADSCGDVYNSPCIDAGDPAIFDSMLGCDWGLGELRSDMGAYGGEGIPTDVDEEQFPEIPLQFLLSQNYPNPFNAYTVIQYNLPKATDVTIDIYDLLGRKVETLIDQQQQAGYHQVIWNAKDKTSGIYFYRIKGGYYTETKKMILLK